MGRRHAKGRLVFSRAWLLPLAGVSLLVGAGVTATGTAGDSEKSGETKWELARLEARQSAYPQAFRDSLRTAKEVEYRQGMRQVGRRGFMRGETLTFDVAWGPVTAGRGVLSIEPDTQSGQFVVTAEGMTNAFFSALYKVRDYLYCTIDQEGLYPLFFEEHLREGRYRADRWVLFDHVNERVFTHKAEHACVEAPRFTQSLASLLYYLRCIGTDTRRDFTVDCFVQKQNYAVVFRLRRKDRLKTDLGVLDCNVFEPVLVGKGRVFTHKDKIRMWLTDDERALPVLIKSKVAVGSISVRIIEYLAG